MNNATQKLISKPDFTNVESICSIDKIEKIQDWCETDQTYGENQSVPMGATVQLQWKSEKSDPLQQSKLEQQKLDLAKLQQ